MSYYFSKTVASSFEQAIIDVTAELKKEGFGIMTEIDVTQALKEKIGVDFRPYRILGACDPNYAYQALTKEERIGLMLPCNVLVQESSKGAVEVAAIDPMASMQAIENESLASVALEVQEKLRRVIDAL